MSANPIRCIADVRSMAEEFSAKADSGEIRSALMVVQMNDETFAVNYTPGVTDQLVNVIGQIEFAKRDLMREVYGA